MNPILGTRIFRVAVAYSPHSRLPVAHRNHCSQTVCIFQLEEEWNGVQKERGKWMEWGKMEDPHRRMRARGKPLLFFNSLYTELGCGAFHTPLLHQRRLATHCEGCSLVWAHFIHFCYSAHDPPRRLPAWIHDWPRAFPWSFLTSRATRHPFRAWLIVVEIDSFIFFLFCFLRVLAPLQDIQCSSYHSLIRYIISCHVDHKQYIWSLLCDVVLQLRGPLWPAGTHTAAPNTSTSS